MLNCFLEMNKNVQKCWHKLYNSGSWWAMLHIPIILLMVCTIFAEEKMLPKRKTDIVGTIFKLALAREQQKIGNKPMNSINDILFVLGMFSLESSSKWSWTAFVGQSKKLLFQFFFDKWRRSWQNYVPVLLLLFYLEKNYTGSRL